MKKIIFALMAFACCLIFISCQKTLLCPDCSSNKPPIAVAGPDQIITFPVDSVLLDGSSSTDPDGTIVSYAWTKISGPASFKIVKSDSAKTTVNQLVQGIYQFELTIKDNGGLYSKDTSQIIVYLLPPPANNSSVAFWTSDIFYTNNPINININYETKILDESWGGNGDPLCYPYGGSMIFDLPAGTYTYKTWRQGRDTIRGSVIVVSGVCNSVQISY
jgi:hypothetical protein